MREAIINLSDEDIEAMGLGQLVSMCREASIRNLLSQQLVARG